MVRLIDNGIIRNVYKGLNTVIEPVFNIKMKKMHVFKTLFKWHCRSK